MTGVRAENQLLPPGALPIGLGCSRLGSVGGASKGEARTLLHHALDQGVRFFDTANIYAQGDSERLLGEALKRYPDALVVSKAGKYVTWQRRALVPLKGLMRVSVRGSSAAKQGVATVRSKPMPTNWDPKHLTRSLERSLTRLGREQIDVFMLHSPSAGVLRDGFAVGALDVARHAGKVGVVGVSVDDVDTALACLQDDRVRALQIPLRPGDSDYDGVLEAARLAGVAIVAREILGGIGSAAAQGDPQAYARHHIGQAVRNPKVAVALVGATKVSSVSATVEAVRAAMSDGS